MRRDWKRSFSEETRIKLLNALVFLGGFVMLVAGLVNFHVLYWVGKTPKVVSWPKYLQDGHGSGLVDILFMLTCFEVLACILIEVVGHNQRFRGVKRKLMVWGCSAFTFLLALYNYYTCSQIASAC